MTMTDAHFRYKIPDKITALIDTREKYPILFPATIFVPHPELPYKQLPIAVETKMKKLDAGDYALEGYESVCAIERKASQLEIFKNMTDGTDRARQARAFRRLASACEYPYILIEVSPAELFRADPRVKAPEIAAHRLSIAMAKYGLRALFVPWKSRSADTRRKMGTLMLHIMLGAVLSKTYDVPVTLLEEED